MFEFNRYLLKTNFPVHLPLLLSSFKIKKVKKFELSVNQQRSKLILLLPYTLTNRITPVQPSHTSHLYLTSCSRFPCVNCFYYFAFHLLWPTASSFLSHFNDSFVQCSLYKCLYSAFCVLHQFLYPLPVYWPLSELTKMLYYLLDLISERRTISSLRKAQNQLEIFFEVIDFTI